MLSYLFHSSVSLILLYMFYSFMVRYESNHQLNRFLGLICLFFSVVLPITPTIDLFQSDMIVSPIHTSATVSSGIQEGFSQVASHEAINIFCSIYLVGVGIFSIRTFIGFATLLYFYFRSKRYRLKGFTVVTLNKRTSPFTFFNVLFLGNQRIKNEDLDILLWHEEVHLNQFHSIDTLILEFMTILFWFNPAIWFFQRAIRAEHEYRADKEVLKKDVCMLDYQELLFRTNTGVSIQLGNYFLRSKRSLIKRYKVMTKQYENSKNKYVRSFSYVFLVILIFGLSSFARMDTGVQPGTPAQYGKGDSVMYQTIARHIQYSKNAREANQSGLVHVSFTVNEQGSVENIRAEKKDGTLLDKITVVGYSDTSTTPKSVSDALEWSGIEAVGKLGEFIPAQKNNKPVSSVLILPIEFKLL